MNATAYEIRREATSGLPTNIYEAVACGGMCDAVSGAMDARWIGLSAKKQKPSKTGRVRDGGKSGRCRSEFM